MTRWAYGMTTVKERIDNLAQKTLASLAKAGFDKPRLFVDDPGDYSRLGLEVTTRTPRVRTFGNWSLALWELMIRHSEADRYAIFQDDFVTYRNLRQYLEQVTYPEKGYLNLYTFPSNQELVKDDKIGWFEARELDSGATYHGKKQQTGRGAVALVFSKEAAVTLLTHWHFVTKPLEAAEPWRRVDGCVVTAMNKAGWREFVHNPSLVQHVGDISSMLNPPHKKATSFRGEDFDALELLNVG